MSVVVLFLSWRDIDEFLRARGARGFHVVLFVLLALFVPFGGLVAYVIVQRRLNDGWMAATDGRAVAAPMMTGDWIAIAAGWVVIGAAVAYGVAAG